MQHQLTQPSTFHFLRRDRKDAEYLNHYINNHVRHGRSRCNANVNLKPLKESFDAVKEVDELVSASASVLSCLKSGYQYRSCKGAVKDTNQEENANACKDYVSGWECLESKYWLRRYRKKIS